MDEEEEKDGMRKKKGVGYGFMLSLYMVWPGVYQ